MNPTPGLPPAPLWRRLAAIGYDLLLVVALLMLLTAVIILVRGGAAIEPGTRWFQGLLIAACLGYFAASWKHGGQTVGMRAWRLVLTTRTGGQVGWGQASLRFLAAGVSVLPLGLGFFWSVFDRDKLAWHDRLSGTALGSRKSPALAQSQDSEQRHDQ